MTTAFAVLARLATIAWALVLLDVHRRPTGYHPLRDAVSDYGVGPYRGWYRAQTALAAAAGIFLLVALALGPGSPWWLLVLLGAFAAARLLIPSFPTDLDRTHPTPTGRIHLLLAATAFACVAVVAGNTPHDLAPRPLQHAVVVTAIATVLVLRLRLPLFGLVERLFYAATIAWFLWVSFALG